jgi:hypothetical protein
MPSTAAISADRKKLQRELAEHLREKDRVTLGSLRAKIEAARAERRHMVRGARETCRSALLALRERQAAERRRLTLEHQAERDHGRVTCITGKSTVCARRLDDGIGRRQVDGNRDGCGWAHRLMAVVRSAWAEPWRDARRGGAVG